MRYHIKIKFIQCLLVLLMCLASLSLYGEVWDRGIIFFIGPDIDGGNSAMASFAKKIDRKNILKNHFGAQNISKVFTINGYMPDIKPGRLNKYKKLVIYITLHGFKRGGEKELYIVKGKAAQRDINDFRSDPNRKSLPNGVTQFSSFIEDIRANIDRKSSNTLYIFEICSLLSRAKRGGEGLKESMSENLEDFANENYAASVGDLVPDCDKDMLEDLQNALDRRTTSGVKSISIKDLQTIFPSGCVKVNMVRDMILNPRVLCFYKDVGDKKEYLNEIDLGNGVSDLNRPLSLTINGNSIEILKVSDTTYHIKKDGKNTEKEDYANRTYALFNIQEISGYSLSFESQYPDQVLPKTGAHKVRKGQKVRFQAYDRGNIKFLYFLVNGKRDHIEKKGNMYELEIEINGDTHVTAEFGR